MQQYESVYKNTGTTPRTLSQANKDVDYATPIHMARTELDDAKEFFIGLVVFALFVMSFLAIGYGFVAWLDIRM
jgi:hypothetical protein